MVALFCLYVCNVSIVSSDIVLMMQATWYFCNLIFNLHSMTGGRVHRRINTCVHGGNELSVLNVVYIVPGIASMDTVEV